MRRIGVLMILFFICGEASAQTQACPLNINYSTGTLSHWEAYTGRFQTNSARTPVITINYDSTASAPTGTIGVSSIPEYGQSVTGILTNTSTGIDPFGGFNTIPTINGYKYGYSILIGSTTVSSSGGGGGGSAGGYIRGVSYQISVPSTPVNQPYTLTYAYAMVLENAPHLTAEVPLFSSTLNTGSGTISCADAYYQLPTIASGSSFVLDQNAAAAEGFTFSSKPSPNQVNGTESPYRVWTKGWTEVTVDLSPYRGQQVTLTFEADNCVPGGHFAYAYVALRNQCNGLTITGDSLACSNGSLTYSIPSLAGATYHWQFPASWNISSDSTSNIVTVTPGNQGGYIVAVEKNSCANLTDTLQVGVTTPTIPGIITGNNTVCAGFNSSTINVSGNTGTILNWLASTDGVNWSVLNDTTTSYTAVNLNTTTQFRALVQNGNACAIDSTPSAVVTVNPVTVAGTISPATLAICQGQNKGATLTLNGYTGNILNWQYSLDSISWTNFTPVKTDSLYNINNVNVPTYFRAVIQSGVCSADPSSAAFVGIYNTPFPKATVYPADTTICFGSAVHLNPIITTGTNYTWSDAQLIYNGGNGIVSYNPFPITALAAPSKSTNYIISILNNGCPNALIDTMFVNVTAPIVVNAGNDTTVVANQPLQLTATASDSTANAFLWTPATGLNFTNIYNPIATLTDNVDSITYTVTASTSAGCFGEASVIVRVFKTGPEIFVPSAFTPNGDGKNDILKPITVGIKTLTYFKVFNRWGQMVFATSEFNKGWDGNINGTPQASGTYVYMAQGIDYNGKTVFRKGTVVLIK